MKHPGTSSGEKLQTNTTKLKLHRQVLLWLLDRFLQDFLEGIPARHSCKGSRRGFRKVLAKATASFIACHNFKKERNKTKPKEVHKLSSYIGSSNFIKRFQQSSSQTSNITNRHTKKSKKQYYNTSTSSYETVTDKVRHDRNCSCRTCYIGLPKSIPEELSYKFNAEHLQDLNARNSQAGFEEDLHKSFSQGLVKDRDQNLHARTPKRSSQDVIKGLGADRTRS